MKYIMLTCNLDNKELRSRQEYLYDVFKLFTIPFKVNGVVELKTFPFKKTDLLFMYGHNIQVNDYLKNHTVIEKNIVLITCYIGSITNLKLRGKNLYYSDVITNKLDGKRYGFDFDITNSELNLYNSKEKSIYKRIQNSFERIRWYGKINRKNEQLSYI